MKEKNRYQTDPVFREKQKARSRKSMKKLYDKQTEKDKETARIKQRLYRLNNPDSYNYMMGRFYFKRLTPDKRKELVKEVEENGKI